MECPVGECPRNVPEPTVVRTEAVAYDEPEPAQRAGFDEYFVVRTQATARRYPRVCRAGQGARGRGRGDLLKAYPHSTLAVIEDAGHALMHERPELFAPLFVDWLDRARTRIS